LTYLTTLATVIGFSVMFLFAFCFVLMLAVLFCVAMEGDDEDVRP